MGQGHATPQQPPLQLDQLTIDAMAALLVDRGVPVKKDVVRLFYMINHRSRYPKYQTFIKVVRRILDPPPGQFPAGTKEFRYNLPKCRQRWNAIRTEAGLPPIDWD